MDNRDYSVNEVCDSRHLEIATLQATTSYTHDTLYVNMRHFMLSSLLCLQDATSNKNGANLDTIVSQFRSDVMEKAANLPDLEVCVRIFPLNLIFVCLDNILIRITLCIVTGKYKQTVVWK